MNPVAVLSVPGKTFLAGEYLALIGGPSLIATTEPRFQMSFFDLAQERVSAASAQPRPNHLSYPRPFADASPAGRFVKSKPEVFEPLRIEFLDPHAGLGGLGASSAQFALVYAFAQKKYDAQSFDWAPLLQEYRVCAWNGEGAPPSGADLVAQIAGAMTEFDGSALTVSQHSWRFASLDFSLLRTGVKLATHEHLKFEQVNARSREQTEFYDALRANVSKLCGALQAREESVFCQAIDEVGSVLAKHSRVAEHTRELLNELSRQPFTRAAKGCGAMGADIVLLLHDREARASVDGWAKSRAIQICGRSSDLAAGLESHPAQFSESEI